MPNSTSSRFGAHMPAHPLIESLDRRRFLNMLGGVAATAALGQPPADRAAR
jgi:hypothetical protein